MPRGFARRLLQTMNHELPNRRSVRITDFTYRLTGACYVTICTADRRELLGSVLNGACQLTDVGVIVSQQWHALAERWATVNVDVTHIVMPNHIHGIIWLDSSSGNHVPRLGDIVGAFKSEVTKAVRKTHREVSSSLWQRSFYDHVIRDEDDLLRIRQYIETNPAKWEEDEYYRT